MDKKLLAIIGICCLAIGLVFSASGMMLLGCVLLLGATLAHAVESK